jgi:hypothetical protein
MPDCNTSIHVYVDCRDIRCETRPPYCTVVHFVYILMDPDQTWKACHKQIRLENMKFAGVNIYGHPNIWSQDQHRLATKNFFYLELKRNRQFYRFSAEEITIGLPAPPMTNGKNYEKTFALKLFGSHTRTHYHFNTTSDKIYMTNKSALEIFPCNCIRVNSFNPRNAILDFGQCCLLNLITYFGTKKHCSAC